MSNKEQLHRDITLGIQAEKLMRDDLLVALIFDMKNEACEGFMHTAMDDDLNRSKYWHNVQGAIRLESKLQQLIETGRMAKEQLDTLESASSFSNPHSPFKEGNA